MELASRPMLRIKEMINVVVLSKLTECHHQHEANVTELGKVRKEGPLYSQVPVAVDLT